MQTKKAYAALIVAILMFSMVLMVLPMQLASAAPIVIQNVFDEDGGAINRPTDSNVGDGLIVNGSGATPGGLVEVYWDEVDDWDEETHTGLVATDHASSISPYEWEVEFDVPETANGTYGIIAYDVKSATTDAIEFIVDPELTLDPDAGLEGIEVEVDGTGFGEDVRDLDVYFDWNTTDPWDPSALAAFTPPYNATELEAAGLDPDEKTEAYSINTNEFGTFTAPDRFTVPDDVTGGVTYTVVGIDETGAYGTDQFRVGFYITLDPDEGPPEITVTIEGIMTEESDVTVEWGIWDTEPVFPGVPRGDWVVGTRRTVLETTTDSDGYFEAEFEVPDVEAHDSYLVLATDETDAEAYDWFEVLEEPTITLIPDSGMPGDEIEVEGDYFTEDSDITLTFDGIDVTPAEGIETDDDGSFEAEFVVPDVTFGDYEVEAEDEEGLSDTDDFEVREFLLIVRPRAGPYYRGATMSWEVKSTEDLRDIEIDIYDPTGYPFYSISWEGPALDHPGVTKNPESDVVFEEDPDFYYVPWYNQEEWLPPLPDDAPLGTWKYEGELEYYDESAERWKDYDIDGSFTVVELPYETMGASLAGIEDDVATIKTDLGTVKGDMAAVAGDVSAVAGDVAGVKSDVAGVKSDVAAVKSDVAGVKSDLSAVKSDVAAVKGEFPIEVPLPDLTPMWVAAILSLIAAIAAIAAVVQISRKLA